MSFIAKIDRFGVPYIPKITQDGQNLQKSHLGGCLSLGIYSIALIYFAQVLYQWFIGGILPTVQIQQDSISSLESYSLNNLIKLQYKLSKNITNKAENKSFNDPFSKTSNILTTELRMYSNDIQQTLETLYSSANPSCTQIAGYGKPICLQTKSAVSFDPKSSEKSNSGFMVVFQCDSTNCSPYKSKFSTQSGLKASLSVLLTDFNPSKRGLDTIESSQDVLIDPNIVNVITLKLQSTYLTVDTGILLPSLEDYHYISGVTSQLQYVTPEYFLNTYQQGNAQFALKIELDSNQVRKRVNFPKLGEVLASILPIFQILMIVSYLALFFNNYTLESRLEQSVIDMFVPWLKDLKPKSNWKGQCIEVVDQAGEKYDPKEYTLMIEKIKKMCQSKLNFVNIVYELSRIQFILQSMVRREYFLASHQLVSQNRLPKFEDRPKTPAQVQPAERIGSSEKRKPRTQVDDYDPELISEADRKEDNGGVQIQVVDKPVEENDPWLIELDDICLMMMRAKEDPKFDREKLPTNDSPDIRNFFNNNMGPKPENETK